MKCPSEVPYNADSYCFLHLTDLHSDFDRIKSVKDLLEENPRRYVETSEEKSFVHSWRRIDFILASGDLTNMKTEQNDDPLLVLANEAEVEQVLAAMEAIHPIVFFIPGNVSVLQT